MAELKELQHLVQKVRAERGFTKDPLKIFAMINEEIGEVAKELKKRWNPSYDEFSKEKLAEEIADVQVVLLALANQFEIDVEEALRAKFIEKDSKREWKKVRS